MVYVKKEDLKVLWDALKPKITKDDLERLKQQEPAVWARQFFKISSDATDMLEPLTHLWEVKFASRASDIVRRIKEVLAVKAKDRRDLEPWPLRKTSLSKRDLLQIADIIGLKINRKVRMHFWEMLSVIIKHISS
jgi:hypothetical protein